jgi:uncharacterized protein YbaP (TraB family)
MKSFSNWFGIALLLVTGSLIQTSAAAEPAHPEKPLLWKIEGGNLKKPSYLFGTIHLSVAPVGNLHPAAEKAFAASEVIHTEIPLDTASQLAIVPMIMRKDGKTLGESIGAKTTGELVAELKQINPQLDATPFQSFKTWAVAMTVPMLKFQLKGEKGLDAKLWERATRQGKKTGALETADSQVKVFESFTEAEQVIYLSETLKQLREDRAAGKDSVADLIAAYASGDEKKVQATIDESMARIAAGEHKELGERFMKRLLTDRDVSMAATIDEKLRAEPEMIHFFAVGAGHYVGKPGIRGILTGKGYRITPIIE